jgi:hypothetical protein
MRTLKYPNFQHHPDGYIFVRTSCGVYMDTIVDFQADYGQTYAGLPEEYIGRYYEPGVDHCLHTNDSATPQDLNWPEGNAYIAAYDLIIAAKAAREAANIITNDDTAI